MKKEKPELNNIHSQILQNVPKRVDEAFKNFFREKNKVKVGCPRFKQFGRCHSFTYPQGGFKIENGQLILSKIDRIKIRKFKAIEGKIKNCSIFKKNNKYYVCFSVETEPKILPKNGKEIGFDLGIKHFLITDQGEFIANPNYLKQSEDKLKFNQQIVSRRD